MTAEVGSADKASGPGGDGGSGNSGAAFNDTVSAGSGDDIIVGDVARSGDGDVDLSAEAGHGGAAGDLIYPTIAGSGGSSNAAAAFNDVISAGEDKDTVVGDVAHSGSGNLSLSVLAGVGGRGGYVYYEEGGSGGSDNTLEAFSDMIDGGVGDDTIVGDVRHTGATGTIALSVLAGVEGQRTYDGEPQRWHG